MPPIRRPRTLSSRSVRGRGFQKKGYRDYGELYFQLKRSYAHFSRYCFVNEYGTVRDLLYNMEDSLGGEEPALPEGLHVEFHFRKQLVIPSNEIVTRRADSEMNMDGGETIYAKVFDVDGYEYEWDGGSEWTAKPNRRPIPRILVESEEYHKPYWMYDFGDE
ncbi:hypothetical protein AC578_5936 [Pseudocercospora eumusae]|uniref:Uncharacterized protein n=1 Tax=Pseudocercospora eumusae TaxID=321146 RepID=A0A139HI33_9PEZI|nr:hypothetical protein AC578_5936 [Pseudocercospora eumusae]